MDRRRAMSDVWTYRDASRLGMDIASADIIGYGIEAIDGSIGKVDDATYDTGASYLIIDTGPWIFGKKVMLTRPKDQIKSAPEYADTPTDAEASRNRLGSYYGVGGPGFRDWEDTR